MIRPSFRLLLEKPQPDGPLGHPTDLYAAEYLPGPNPQLDSVRRVTPLVDSSSDESAPRPLPDGDVAYHSLRGRPGLYRVNGGPVLTLPRIERYAVSPDGRDWAFLSDQALYRFRPGHKPHPVPLPGHQPSEVAFSPQGQLLFADSTGLYRADGLELLAEGRFRDFCLSPDGRRLVYLRGDADGDQLRLRELGGEDRLLCHSASEAGVLQYPVYSQPAFSPDGSRVLYCVSSMEGPCGPVAQSDLRVVGLEGGRSKVLCEDVVGAAA